MFIIPEDKGGETRPFVNQYMYIVGLEWVGLYGKIMSILTKGQNCVCDMDLGFSANRLCEGHWLAMAGKKCCKFQNWQWTKHFPAPVESDSLLRSLK